MRQRAAFAVLAVLTVMFLAVNICAGSVNIPLGEVIGILCGYGQDSVNGDIVLEIRFPRALAAAVLGGGLALSGYLLQAFFHNPIAGPFVLGISQGAKLLVSLFMIFGGFWSVKLGFGGRIAAAFAGSVICMGCVVCMSRVVDRMSMLVVGGVMVGYICSAVTDFLVTFAEDADLVNLHNWSRGSFSGLGWEHVAAAAAVILPAFLCVFLLSKPMEAYQVGGAYVQILGVDIASVGVVLVVLSSILSACVTAFAGPVSFVGIAVPHLAGSLMGTGKPIFMIPACFLGGAVFCLFCDWLARILLAPVELSISTVTAVFGAPVVLLLMVRRRK